VSPKFTKHGEQRAKERGITPQEIDAILYAPDVFSVPSKKDENVAVAYGHAGNRIWAIVYDWKTGNIITVRPASKKERGLYEQKKGN
jgi:uncharacterized DUF497 family protein